MTFITFANQNTAVYIRSGEFVALLLTETENKITCVITIHYSSNISDIGTFQ